MKIFPSGPDGSLAEGRKAAVLIFTEFLAGGILIVFLKKKFNGT